MATNTLRLYYFNLRARAELIRLIFAASGRTWEDIRFKTTEWPEFKPKMLLVYILYMLLMMKTD